jgi:hypothetical protein
LLGSFALNGNHEMYARGFAYFDRMLPRLGLMTNGQPTGQPASYFCLENEFWRIIALDTGYNSISFPLLEYIIQPSCDLRAEQLHWLRTVVRPRRDDQRGIIILSHHQYYSRYDTCYPKQAEQLAEFFPRPVLWFWGHEHRLAVYNLFGLPGGIQAYGRCIGHGGMPVDISPSTTKHSQCTVEFIDERHYRNHENLTIGYNGFAQLSIKRDRLDVQYVDVRGEAIFSEAWTTKDGVLERAQN